MIWKPIARQIIYLYSRCISEEDFDQGISCSRKYFPIYWNAPSAKDEEVTVIAIATSVVIEVAAITVVIVTSAVTVTVIIILCRV